MLSVILVIFMLSVVAPGALLLTVILIMPCCWVSLCQVSLANDNECHFALGHFAEQHLSECYFALQYFTECCTAEWCFAKLSYTDCHSGKCCSNECHSTECRGGARAGSNP